MNQYSCLSTLYDIILWEHGQYTYSEKFNASPSKYDLYYTQIAIYRLSLNDKNYVPDNIREVIYGDGHHFVARFIYRQDSRQGMRL